LDSFRKNVAGRLSALRLWRLPKAYPGSAAVLVDELDAGVPRIIDAATMG
jgi:hypothetical protein